MATKPGVYRTTISIPQKSKQVCDAFVETHGLRENISDFSDLVARALMAYCLPEPGAECAPPATVAAALAAKARAEEAGREMTHAQNTPAPARSRSHPGKGLSV